VNTLSMYLGLIVDGSWSIAAANPAMTYEQ